MRMLEDHIRSSITNCVYIWQLLDSALKLYIFFYIKKEMNNINNKQSVVEVHVLRSYTCA